MALPLILLPLGFYFVVKGADLLVDGAVSIARRYGISLLVIGLTIVAFGTSAADLFVNILASISENGELAFESCPAKGKYTPVNPPEPILINIVLAWLKEKINHNRTAIKTFKRFI